MAEQTLGETFLDKVHSIEGALREHERELHALSNTKVDLNGRVCRLEDQMKKVESRTEEIHRITSSIEKLTEQMGQSLKVLERHEQEIMNFKLKPGTVAIKAWVFVVGNLFVLLAGLYIGRLL